MSDIKVPAVLSRQSLTLTNVQFLDKNGSAYNPTTVEKRVVTETGTQITDWTTEAGFVSGDDVEIIADETEVQGSGLVENHIVLVVGDRTTDTENVLRVIIPCKARETLP